MKTVNKLTHKTTSLLGNDRDQILNELPIDNINYEKIYFYFSKLIHGNPFSLKSRFVDPNRNRYYAYALLYWSSLNCLYLLKNNYVENLDLKKKIVTKIKDEKDIWEGYKNTCKYLEDN